MEQPNRAAPISLGITFKGTARRPEEAVNVETTANVPLVMTTKTEAGGGDQHEHQPESTPSTNGSARPEATKPITIMLPDDLLKKLKIVAIVRESSVSELVAEAAAGVVRRELKRAFSKISGE